MSKQKKNQQPRSSKQQLPEVQKQQPGVQSAGKGSTISAGNSGVQPNFLSNIKLQGLFVAGLAFLLYANTLGHGFTLDDSIVIKDNMFTQKGMEGIPGLLSKDTFFGFFKVEGKETLVTGGRYRPLTPVLFAILFQLFGGESAFPFHLFTVLLYLVTCWVLYRAFVRLLAPQVFTSNGSSTPVLPVITALIAAVLFTVHPLHTEAVANIKGSDEIAALLFSVLALDFTFRARDTGKLSWALAAGGVFFLACLSKENAAAFTLLIPAALFVFRPGKGVISSSWPAWAAFVIFFIIRGAILDWRFGGEPMELMNNPFLKLENGNWVKFSPSERLGTILFTLGKYIQLLLWPHPLTHDYYPKHIDIKSLGDPLAIISLLIYAGLGVFAVLGLRRRDAAAYGILWYLLALSIVSNLVFPIGTNMGERFAFMPSAGFCLAAGVLLVRYFSKANEKNWETPVVIASIVALPLAGKTLFRNPVWQSNDRIFLTDVAVSKNSAKIRNACGGALFDQARVAEDDNTRKELAAQAVQHLNKAIEIYPNYKDAYVSRGGSQYFLGNYEAAVSDYKTALQLAPGDSRIIESQALVLREGGKYFGEKKNDLATAMRMLQESWALNNKDGQTARLLGVAHGVQRKNTEALQWFTKAVELEPNNASFLFDLGTATAIAGDPLKGEALRKKAIEMDPKLLEKR